MKDVEWTTAENIGRFLMYMRADAGLTQSEAARGSGVGQTLISDYEHNKTMPTLKSFCKLMGFYGYKVVVEPDDKGVEVEIVSKGREIPLRELRAGDCFKRGTEWFMKTNSPKIGEFYNAVCLRTGGIGVFSENDMVESEPNAKVVV